MNRIARYDAMCPNGHTTSLTERTLQRIIDNLQESDRDAQQITFVCSHCKTAFRFDYPNREPTEEIDEPPHSSAPFVCIVTRECDDKHCGARLELVAVRNSDTTLEEFHTEVRDWPQMLCGKGRHSAVRFGSVTQL